MKVYQHSLEVRRVSIICLSALLITATGCGANKSSVPVSSGVGSSEKSSSSIVSEMPSSLVPTISSSSGTTSSSLKATSEGASSSTKSLVFAEDDNTKAIFHIGMTRKQVKQALTDNHLRMKPSDYGYSEEELLNELGFAIIGGVEISFDSKTGLLNELVISSASDTEFSSPYETQKGLKIGDTVETVIKRYGKPLEKNKGGDAVNKDLSIAYCYDLPINLNDYYKECKEIVGPDNSSGSKKRGAHLVIDVSQMKGDNFNRVDAIVYYTDNYGDYLR